MWDPGDGKLGDMKNDYDLDCLLLQSEKLTAQQQDDTQHGIPTLHKDLSQLDRMSRKLAQRTAPLMPRGPVDAEAQMLLATKGLDLAKQSRTLQQLAPMLQQIDVAKAYEPESLSELDVERFLEHQYQLLITTAIEECSTLTAKRLQDQFVQAMQEDWQLDKQRILDAEGFQKRGHGALTTRQDSARRVGGGLSRPLTGSAPASSSMALSLVPSQPSTGSLSVEQEEYAQQVQRLNVARAASAPGAGFSYQLVSAFQEASSRIDSIKQRPDSELGNLWELQRWMVGEAEDGEARSASRPDQRSLIRGARRYAEALYKRHLEQQIRRHKKQAQPGGVPGLLPHLRAFLEMHSNRWAQMGRGEGEQGPAMLSGKPFWAQVFLCYRCGELGLAVHLTEQGSQNGVPVSDTFLRCLQHRVRSLQPPQPPSAGGRGAQAALTAVGQEGLAEQEGLPEQLWRRLTEEHARFEVGGRAGLRAEPYRAALYCLVGRLGVDTDHTLLGLDHTEDYLWWRLSLLWQPSNVNAALPSFLKLSPGALSLASLQKYHQELGERHFNPDGRHHRIYFQVLLMSLEFGRALDYLLRQEELSTALHMALGLAFYGLVPRNEEQREVYDSARGTLNLQRLLEQYTAGLEQAHPLACLHYLVFLHYLPATVFGPSGAARGQHKQVLLAMRDLLLKTRQFSLLVGRVSKGRVLQDGALFQVLSSAEAKYVLADSHFGAARKAETNGQYLDAITLYTLANQLSVHHARSPRNSCAVFHHPLHHPIHTLSYASSVSLCHSSNKLQDLVHAVRAKRKHDVAQAKQGLRRERRVQAERGLCTCVYVWQGVSELLLTQLSKLAPKRPSRDAPLREELSQRLHEFRLLNRDLPARERLDQAQLEQLGILEGLVCFFDLYHFGKLDDALRTLASLKILPMLPADADYQKEEVERRFRNLDSRIRLIFGDIARCCMDIYFCKHEAIKLQLSGGRAAALASPSRHHLELQQILQQYVNKAKELNVFIGTNQSFLNISGNVIGFLMNLETRMG